MQPTVSPQLFLASYERVRKQTNEHVMSGLRRGAQGLRSDRMLRNRRFGTTYRCKQFQKKFFNRFTLEDGADRSSGNVGKRLQIHVA
jgi:hypothetical protein